MPWWIKHGSLLLKSASLRAVLFAFHVYVLWLKIGAERFVTQIQVIPVTLTR